MCTDHLDALPLDLLGQNQNQLILEQGQVQTEEGGGAGGRTTRQLVISNTHTKAMNM